MKDLNVIFYKFDKNNHTLIEKLICLWTHSEYYHVELLIDDLRIGILPDKNNILTIANFKPQNLKLFDILYFEITDEQYYDLWKFIKDNIGKKYDWTGIFLSQLFPLNIENPKRFFCSEFVCYCLTKINLIIPERSCQWYHPGALFELLARYKLNLIKKEN